MAAPATLPRRIRGPVASGPRSVAPGSSHERRQPPLVGVPPAAALLPGVLITVVIGWWAWKSGAYFGVVFLPGSMFLLALLAALFVMAPLPGRIQGPARVAVACLILLAAWTLLSELWSPTPDVAIADAQRALMYGVAFVLGVWLCLLLGRRMTLVIAPVAVAAGVIAVVTLVALWMGSDSRKFLEIDGTLRYPIGYRNAEAGYFAIALFPMLCMAAWDRLDWRLRGLLTGTATLAVELAVLSQSRGSLFAAAIGAAVLIAVHPARLRILGWLVLVLVPAAISLPWVLDVFQADGGNTVASIPPLHTACAAMAATSLLAAALGALVARADPAIDIAPGTRRGIGRALVAVLAVLLALGLFRVVTSDGGPGGFFSRHADQLTAGSPDLGNQGTRFGLDLRSNRGDLWQVALDDFKSDPIAGKGGGGFRTSFLLDRPSASLQPEDPHSVEMLMLSELGLPGLLLLGGFIVTAAAAALRARRLGPNAAILVAAALGAAAYWLVHASVEWFWSYPGITLPVVFLLGGAAAPALLRPEPSPRSPVRLALGVGAVVLALSFIPFMLSERYTNDALGSWRSDLSGAYSELDQAADLNPTSVKPLAAEAVIAEASGERFRAVDALERAVRRQPDEWTLYYLQARVLAPIDPAGARVALARAKALNPLSPEIDELESQIAAPTASQPAS